MSCLITPDTVLGVRWDELFADLEGQLEAGLTAEERDQDAEEERLRLGRLSLRDRIAAIAGGTDPVIRVQLVTGDTIPLRPRTVGRDWVAGDLGGVAQGILPLAGVAALLPTPEQMTESLRPPPAGSLTDRLGLPFVLRDLCRRRSGVELLTRGGTVSGTVDRVGRDHLDLAVHPLDRWRRPDAVAQLRIVALAELVLVRLP